VVGCLEAQAVIAPPNAASVSNAAMAKRPAERMDILKITPIHFQNCRSTW